MFCEKCGQGFEENEEIVNAGNYFKNDTNNLFY